ncbi:MAG: hypothetical protein CGU29_10655 [Candidatus Dactylopiibacterium carminicum]|uniref:BcpO-related WXXGXW repeat protein n=1 Tax=Candidatus Dactylopiibacterium carminicum TaxID=857335 RepID=A0A272ESK1_9RHOO|nr:YXWGXW repeat-containing protein [Candidatus Dactylopiibacterium carminicum]KAF7598783.1 hypothetical protein BGI27_11320 [Candidatus Dactylopiibacterium carminicum]PAS92690.1 MAG: hypothetical protein CGU29_10655 [Candidatus Dactylopiibacterium carminicum]PAS98804.1 MAG: hypothetical protein BSR46_11335 [Candidatus Dactylopiibacterium carminicum]
MKTASRLIATLGMIAAPLLAAPAAQARVDVNVFIPGVSVDVRVGPPPLRYERLPGPRAGYLWRTGYWQWSPHGYVWIPGAWMSSRPGHIWVGEQWSPYGGNWHFQPGRWERRVEYREYRPPQHGHGRPPSRHDGRDHHPSQWQRGESSRGPHR